MPREQLEALFLKSLPAIEKVLAGLARRHSLSAADADEFASWARLRLIEDDYATLGKFRGESSITTYLTVVLAMLFREYRVQEWGRWRPSAAAKRHGGIALKLEVLTQRDRMPIFQAGELLRTAGETRLSDKELSVIVASFPRRSPLRPVEFGVALPADVTAYGEADEFIVAEEATEQENVMQRALTNAMEALGAEDRLIIRMRFMNELTVADIARGLAIKQKPLYRRIDRAITLLRQRLEQAGVSREVFDETFRT